MPGWEADSKHVHCCMSEWTQSSRPACGTKYMLAFHVMRMVIQRDVCTELTYPKLSSFHLCAAAVADDGAMWTARDIIIGCLSNAFRGHLDRTTVH